MGEVHTEFAAWAEMHKKSLQEPCMDREQIGAKVKAFEFLATCTDADIFALFDTSAFNDILKGYAMLAIREAELEEEDAAAVMRGVRLALDDIGAEKACQYYMEH